jgi:LAO/AO transport system kinase
MLKAGILEIGDVFVVNKADLKGADRTVQELEEMIHMQADNTANLATGHHGAGAVESSSDEADDADGDDANESQADEGEDADDWQPTVVETVAKSGEGVEKLVETLADHRAYLESSGLLERKERMRYAEEIRNLLRDDVGSLLESEIERHGGMDELVEAVRTRETDPYSVADEILDPIEDCLEDRDN